MHNFKYFFREGAGNMLSHGFMSFAAVGVTVACLLIMGTFSLVAYNANINLQDLQKENAVVAFVDESLTDDEATALQSRLAAIPGVADCTFVSRQEARDEYVAQYNEDDLYSDLDPSIFRHRYVMHLTDLNRMGQVVQSLESVEGIAKVRADQHIGDAGLDLPGGGSHRPHSQAQIIVYGFVADQAEILKDHADGPAHQGDLPLGDVAHGEAVDHHPAPGGHQLAGQELDDGGLAAAGGAHQEHELPVLYLEGNSV